MATDSRPLTGGGQKSIALVGALSAGDPVLHWLCRNLNEVGGVSAKIFVPEHKAPEFSALASWMAVNFSSRTNWDRAVFFCNSPEEAEANLEAAYALRVDSGIFVDPRSDDQEFSSIAPRLSYALESNVEVLSCSQALKLFQTVPFARRTNRSLASTGKMPERPRVTFFSLSEEDLQSVRGYLDNAYNPLSIQVLTSGSTKSSLLKNGFTRPTFNVAECCPQYVLSRTDLLVDLSESLSGDLHGWILAQARGSGIRTFARWTDGEGTNALGLLIGGGTVAEFCASLVTLLSSDPGLRGLPPPTVCEICVAEADRNLTDMLGDARPQVSSPVLVTGTVAEAPSVPSKRVVLMAINGHGLGHAQRIAAVAGAVRSQDPKVEMAIATFPTCFEFVGARGHTVIPLTNRPLAQNDAAVEAANLKRLLPVLANADLFVFDGGHPYDAVVGLLQEFPGESIWIRRGLWRHWQDNLASHEREKYFSQVVRPLEAFEELNFSSRHSSIEEVTVGPIVAEDEGLEHVESFLAPHRESGKRVVVTMLGSGQAGQREHLSHFVCRSIEKLDDVVNILIVWPQDRAQAPLTTYHNTIVIQTVWGTAFVKHADLLITACGYNTFHECLYFGTPALFIPQSAGWLDDQKRRAQAAADRGVAAVVEQDDVMGLRDVLDRLLVSHQLADLSGALEDLELPPLGSAQLAEMIRNGVKPTC